MTLTCTGFPHCRAPCVLSSQSNTAGLQAYSVSSQSHTAGLQAYSVLSQSHTAGSRLTVCCRLSESHTAGLRECCLSPTLPGSRLTVCVVVSVPHCRAPGLHECVLSQSVPHGEKFGLCGTRHPHTDKDSVTDLTHWVQRSVFTGVSAGSNFN